MRLQGVQHVVNGHTLAMFPETTRDIGRHAPGLLFVDVVSLARQRVALCDDSDRVDVESMHPWARDLLELCSGGGCATLVVPS